jgi:ferric-dicitrate binding protein FerR (iron transport regulator)
MAEDYTEIDPLLAKQLAGEASADERESIRRWLEQSADNRRYFESLQRLWDGAGQSRKGLDWEVDTESALTKVKTRMQAGPAMRVKSRFISYPWLAAATLALLIAAVWFLRPGSQSQAVDLTSKEATMTDTLSDGSTVVLNRHSGLRIAENFNRTDRRMRLTGEAFFQVTHDAQKPFIVEAGPLEVTVVGTEFNIDNRQGSGKIIVSVTSGRVQLKTAAQTEMLTAGQQAICDASGGLITRVAQPDPNVLAYKTRHFRFDGTALSEVIRQLNDVYDAHIYLKNKELGKCPLNTTFNNPGLDQALDIIAESFSLQIERSAAGIGLDGPGCEQK